MPIDQSAFNNLCIGDSVAVCQRSPSRYIRTGVVQRITKTTKVIYCSGIEYSFMNPTRHRGEKWGGAFIGNHDDIQSIKAEVIEANELSRLNNALGNVGKLRAYKMNGDEILMALADATAKAELFYNSQK